MTTTTTDRRAVGALTIEPLDPARDAAVVQTWLSHPASAWWEMTELDVDDVRTSLSGVVADPHQDAWLGRRNGEPAFLVETYDPSRVLLTDVWDADPGDLGMHLLVAPAPDPADRVHGLTSAVMRAVVRHCVDVLGARRIVVEPDVRNTAVHAKNAEVGFRVLREVDVDGKRALLSVLDAADAGTPAPDDPAPHLVPRFVEPAERHVVAKALAEFTHERLLAPQPDGGTGAGVAPDRWRIDVPGGDVYRFRARRHELEHWSIDEGSLTRSHGDQQLPLDAQALVTDLRADLGLPDTLLGTYLEELASTIASAAEKRRRGGPSAAQLAAGRGVEVGAGDVGVAGVAADFQAVESAMTEGHPGFVAANGRIGFGLDEFHAYAPEAGRTFRYVWVAARRELSHLATGDGLTEDAHWAAELDPDTVDRFRTVLERRGLDPDDYRWIPVHPWQWQHRIAVTFAPDLGRQDLVVLGGGPDRYQPQQSIRTAFNRDRPDRSYVKTALSIQNMGFLRGLSPAYMRDTPAVNDWVHDLVSADETLREARFTILRERASVGYTGDAYHRVAVPSAQQKMLAALWRESPVPDLAPGERLATMASLLHRDARGASVVTALIRRSGLPASEWVARYLHAYLRPVVHCLTEHELAFMPHGENVVLVLRDGAVDRVVMKDIGEEVAVLGPRTLPDRLGRIVHPVDDDEVALAVFTDVFDGVLRHVAAILDDDGTLASSSFWALVGACIDRHTDEHPDRARPIDFRAPDFSHSCLNRLQLRNTLQMVDLSDQSSSLIHAGRMANPIG